MMIIKSKETYKYIEGQRIEYISMKKNSLIVNRVKKKEKKSDKKENVEKRSLETKKEKVKEISK